MKKVVKFARRALSFVLCLAMVMTTMFFFDIGITRTEAAISQSAVTKGRVVLYVPEVIYLTPNANSLTSETAATFQYYVQNDLGYGSDGWYDIVNVSNAIQSQGAIYFAAEDGYDASSVAIGYKFVDSSYAPLSGTVYFSDRVDSGEGSMAFSYYTITGGTSPYLAASTMGCYIEWTLTYKETGSGETKAVIAYTYVYKPYILPVGAASRAKGAWHNTFASSILWVSGVHGYTDGDRPNNYYTVPGNFSPMTGTIMTPNNTGPDQWVQSGSNGMSPTMSWQYVDAGGVKYHARANTISPTATITVDTSRYNNFNQIPNFKIAYMITDQENTTTNDCAWYISDFTGQTSSYYNGTATGSSQYTGDFNSKGTVIKEASGRGMGAPVYNDVYNKAISGSGDFRIKGAVKSFYNATIKSTAWNNNFVNISVSGVDKSALRAKVNEAYKKFAQYGVTSGYGSYYYNTNSNQWQNFVSAYRLAYMELTKVDGLISSSVTIQNRIDNLTNAMNQLETLGKRHGDAFQYNVGLMKNRDGTYRVIEIPQASTIYKEFTYGDKLEFTAESYSGYTYKGMLKLDGETGIDTVTADTTLATLPTFSSESNKVNHALTVSGKTLTISSGETHPTTGRATFSGSTVTYPSATDDARTNNDSYRLAICYIYFYELNEAEVIFGNEFDFDHFDWSSSSGADSVKADRIANTLTFTSNSTTTDAYTESYSSTQQGYMTLIPGRTYEFSCSVKNNSSKEVRPNMFFFTFDTAPSSNTSVGIGTSGTDFISVSTTLAANGTGTITGTLTIPSGRPYATIRVGTYTPSASLTFSNIVVRDITTFTTPLLTNSVTMPDPLYKTGLPGASITGFPVITRPGYQLAGWSTVREANGNGAAANMVTSVAVPSNGNETLYPVWQTNVIYNANGG
ncbi:MAG: hypothetical protein J6L62_02880, partial [Clostridia bacterium]|nr:hypothetical protein [Clostridia bacterium]